MADSPLWDSNESLYAETAREMLERSDFLHPTFNYTPRLQKPPFTYWAIAVSYRALGLSEFAVRLPAALTATLFLGFLVWFLARHETLRKANRAAAVEDLSPGSDSDFLRGWGLSPTSAAWLAGLILATTPRFLIVVRRLPIDALLLVAMSAALLLAYRAIEAGKAIRRADPEGGRVTTERITWLAAGFMAGLAFMIKGPVGPLLMLLIGSAFLVRERYLPSPTSMGICLAGFLAAAAPYYGLLALRGESDVLYQFLLHENVERYASVDFGPRRGPFYYLPILLADTFPWALFLPAALILPSLRREKDSLIRFCWIWFGAVLLFFSLARNKQEYYILPAYVPMAILLGRFFSALSRHQPDPAWRARYLGWVPALAGAALLGATLRLRSLAPLPVGFEFAVAAVAAGMALAAWSFHRLRPARGALITGTSLLLLLCSFGMWLLPVLDAGRPVRLLAREIQRLRRPGDPAGYFLFDTPSLAFYLQSEILQATDPAHVDQALDQSGRLYLVTQEKLFATMPEATRARLEPLASAAWISTRGRDLLKLDLNDGTEPLLLLRERK